MALNTNPPVIVGDVSADLPSQADIGDEIATGSPDAVSMPGPNPLPYSEPTGQKSGIDGSPLFWTKPEGERNNYTRISLAQIQSRLKKYQSDYDVSDEDMDEIFGGQDGISWNGGDVAYSGETAGGQRVDWQNSTGGSIGNSSFDAGGRPAPRGNTSTQPGASTSTNTGGNARGATGGNARGGVNDQPAATETGGGGVDIDAGGSPGSGPSIDPDAPLGIDFSRDGGINIDQGDPRFTSDLFPRQGDITEGLDRNSTLQDIMLNALRTQQGQQSAALGIAGGLMEGYEDDPLRASFRGRAGDLLDNPFSLDDATIARIQGQQAELIGQNAQQQRDLSAGRAAASGISRSGIQGSEQDVIGINADRALADSQRGLLIEQATRRPQELAGALQAGGGALQQDQSNLQRLGGAGIDILRDTDITSDALALGTLASGQTPQVNVSYGADQGPISARYGTLQR